MLEKIVIRGARQHNLRNISLEIPRHKLTVVTGLSGSGKSSLAFDTIYAEGQRRYIESLSTYARQFLERMEKPELDSAEGLSPAISIEQKTTSRSPRSTVGTITEIYDYARLLFASIGRPHCPRCGKPIAAQTADRIVQQVLEYPEGTRVVVMAPVVRDRKGEFRQLFETFFKKGYLRVRVDGRMHELEEPIPLAKTRNHTIEVVVDRVVVKPGIDGRLESSVRKALELAEGLVTVEALGIEERLFSERQACLECGVSVATLEPRSFSFNSRHGACPDCDGMGKLPVFNPESLVPDPGLGIAEMQFPIDNARIADHLKTTLLALARRRGIDPSTPFGKLPKAVRTAYFSGGEGQRGVGPWLRGLLGETRDPGTREELDRLFRAEDCPACGGARLRPESRAVRINGLAISDYARMSLAAARDAFAAVTLSPREERIAGQVLGEIRDRLEFLINVGVGYLSLDRPAASLSGGEGQRIRLATQIGSKLRGVLYVLDEPSIGLHPRDNRRLLDTLADLRDMGNTILVVEHDEETMRAADHIIDLGPGGGRLGGRLVAEGSVGDLTRCPESITGAYLSGARSIGQRSGGGGGKRLVVMGPGTTTSAT